MRRKCGQGRWEGERQEGIENGSADYPLINIKSQFRLQSSAQSYSELSLFHGPTSQRKRKR